MDPISLAIGAVGLGMQIFGGLAGAGVAKQQAKVSEDEAVQEQGINNAKQQAMVVQNNRMQLENSRNMQRARANAENASVNQGAQFGSGIQGGLAQVTDQGLFNGLGNNQAVQTGQQINQFNQNISSDKQQLASLGGTAATDAGIASLGGALLKSGPVIGGLAKGFGNFGSGGNFSGTPGASNTGGLY